MGQQIQVRTHALAGTPVRLRSAHDGQLLLRLLPDALLELGLLFPGAPATLCSPTCWIPKITTQEER